DTNVRKDANVRKDSNDRKDANHRFEKTIDGDEGVENHKYSIAAVYDIEKQIHHVCVYIHHNDNREESKKDAEANKQLKFKLSLAIEIIKVKLCKYMKSKYKKFDAKKLSDIEGMRVIVSGDLNCTIPNVEEICREKAENFIWLKDKLHPSWRTFVRPYYGTSGATYSKIDYILAHNVFTRIHQPKELNYDHYIIIEDIYYTDPGFTTPYCTDCEKKCSIPTTVLLTKGTTISILEDLIVNFREETVKYESVKSPFDLYSTWKIPIREKSQGSRFPKKIDGISIISYLDKIMNDENSRLKTVGQLTTTDEQNMLSWMCAITSLLEQDDPQKDMSKKIVLAACKKTRKQFIDSRSKLRRQAKKRQEEEEAQRH
ncbi:hypothetical protein PMAYCL1PPCAC_05172, partial [Pristionchus mayeri]